ncbi:MAG: hypothetical protein H6698_05520 [Myxococcales bacterium]|nr:hypothetical protein [Myxococcales bacterium]
MRPDAASAARPLRAIALTLGVALVTFTLRAVVESHRYAAAGDAAVAAGDWESATLDYRHAIQWYVPVVGAQVHAFDSLVTLGDQAAAAGRIDDALVCYRSARFAVMATRSIWTPLADRLPPLHAKIAAAMGQQLAGGGASDPAAVEEFRGQLDAYRERSPGRVAGLGASIAFFAWLAALFAAATRGVGSDGSMQRGPLVRWALVAAVAFCAWIALVRLA